MAPRSPQARRPSKIWAPRSFMDRTEHVCLAPRSWRHSCRFRLTEVGADLWDVDLREFDRYARRHHGLLDFEASGLTRKQWNRASAAEVAELRHRNVMRLYGAPPTVEMRIEAAVLAAGPDAMGSHRSAATTWGVDRPADDPIDIILPQRTRQARLTDVVVHRPRDMKQLQPVWRRGVPVTDPLRTLLDLGAVDPAGVYPALVTMVMARFVTPGAVRALVVRHSQHGRHGIVALRKALDRWSIDDKPADSDLEALMAEILRSFGLPKAAFHVYIGGDEVAFLIVGSKVKVECDGGGTHGADRDQFEFDRVRDAALLAKGYVTLRVTWRQMVATPRAVARRIAATIAEWSPEALNLASTTALLGDLGANRAH